MDGNAATVCRGSRARREAPGTGCATRTPSLHIAPGEVHVWWLNEDAERQDLAPLSALLNPAETALADRFVFARDRARFLLARGTLRRLLAVYTGFSAEALHFATGLHGKPALAPFGPSFNLSHSGTVLLIAVAPAALAVGIDVERHRPLCDVSSLAATCFSPEEHAAWSMLPAEQREASFFRLWARKEAFVKATGEGLAHPIQRITVGLGVRPALRAPAQIGWSLHDLELGRDCSAALAAAHPAPRVSFAYLRTLLY